MNTAKELIKSSVARVGLTIVTTIISFFMLPFLVSKLGDEWYGVWTIISSLTSYYYLADIGLTSAVTRYVARYIAQRDNDEVNGIINTAFLIYSLLGLAIIVISLNISYFSFLFIDNKQQLSIIRSVIIITGMNIAFEFPYKAFSGIIGAYIRYDLLTYAHFLMVILGTVLTVLYLSWGYGIVAMALIGFGCAQLSNILFYFISKHLFLDMQMSPRHVKRKKIRELFEYSLWSFFIQIGDQLRLRISSIMIGYMLSAGHVTHFFIGARLVEMFINLVYRATNILTPVFTKYHAENKYEEIRTKLIFMTKINTVIAIFGGGMFIILGKPFLQRWIGNEYLDAYPVLVTIMVATILEIIMNPAVNAIYAMAKHRQLSFIIMGEGVTNLLLGFLIIGSCGIWGAALAMAMPIVIARIVFIPMIICRSIGITLSSYYAKILKSSAFGIVYLVSAYFAMWKMPIAAQYLSLIMVVIVMTPIYLIGTLFLSLDKQDRARFKLLVT